MSHDGDQSEKLTKSNLIMHTNHSDSDYYRDVIDWVARVVKDNELHHGNQTHQYGSDIETDLENFDLKANISVTDVRTNNSSLTRRDTADENSPDHQHQQLAMAHETALSGDTNEEEKPDVDSTGKDSVLASELQATGQHPATNGVARMTYAQALLAGMGAQFSTGENEQSSQ